MEENIDEKSCIGTVSGWFVGQRDSGMALANGRVAIVFATGGLGDKSFNDSAMEVPRRPRLS